MSVVLIIESDPQIVKEAKNIIEALGEKVEFQVFSDIVQFSNWTKKIIKLKDNQLAMEEKKGQKNSEEQGEEELLEVLPDDFEISMLMVNEQIVSPIHTSLYEKLNKFYKVKELIGERERLPVFFIVRESKPIDLNDFMNPLFDNVLFYPFDFRVCRSQVEWSLKGEDAAKSEELHSEKPLHAIEMLKDVYFERVTELGFKTTSSVKIDKGKVAKYYYKHWQNSERESLFARCVKSIQHPEKDDVYESTFTFFGISNETIKRVKKHLIESEGVSKEPVIAFQHDQEMAQVVLVIHDKDLSTKIKLYLAEYFSNCQFLVFNNLSELLFQVDQEKFFEDYPDMDSTPVELTYTYEDNILITPEAEVGGWNGLQYKDLKRLKTILLSALEGERRRKLIDYFIKGIDDGEVFTVVFKHHRSIRGVSLLKSEFLAPAEEEEKPKGGKKSASGKSAKKMAYIKLTVRSSSKEEIVANYKNLQPLPEQLHLLFMDSHFVKLKSHSFWTGLVEKLRARQKEREGDCHVFSVGDEPIRFYAEADRIDSFNDHFVEPLDRHYFVTKLARFVPHLELKKELAKAVLKTNESLLTSVPVKVTRISEVSCSVEYYRSVDEGRFRRFLLWSAKNRESEMLLGILKGSETNPEKRKEFINHFMFYAQNGKINQFVRKWLNEQYILSKEAEEEK